MFVRIVSLVLVSLMLNMTVVKYAYSLDSDRGNNTKREAKRKKHAAKVKKAIHKLGKGKSSKVKLKLWDKTKIKGYVSEINKNSFTVIDKNGNINTIKYSNVKQIRGGNKNRWVIIGVLIAAVVFIIVYANTVIKD